MENQLTNKSIIGMTWCDNAMVVLADYLHGSVLRTTVANWDQPNLLDAGLVVTENNDIWFELTFQREASRPDLIRLSCLLTSASELAGDYTVILKMESDEWRALADQQSMCATWLIPLAEFRNPRNLNRVSRPLQILIEH